MHLNYFDTEKFHFNFFFFLHLNFFADLLSEMNKYFRQKWEFFRMIRANENRGFTSSFWELFGRFPWEAALKGKGTQRGQAPQTWAQPSPRPRQSHRHNRWAGSSSLGTGTKREGREGQGGLLGSIADHCLAMQAGN